MKLLVPLYTCMLNQDNILQSTVIGITHRWQHLTEVALSHDVGTDIHRKSIFLPEGKKCFG